MCPRMYMSGLYERSVALQPEPAARKAGKQVAYCEMLLSGITSVADLSGNDEGWIDLAARSGLRVFLAPGYRVGALVHGEWLAAQIPLGRSRRPSRLPCGAGADRAGRSDIRAGGLSGIVCPAQIDTCTPDLLRDSFAAAEAKRPAADRALRAERQRVQRDGRPPRQDASAVRARPRHPGAAHRCWGMRSSSTSIRGCAGTRTRTCELLAGYRHQRRALPVAVRALRPRRWRISGATRGPASISGSAPTSPRTT